SPLPHTLPPPIAYDRRDRKGRDRRNRRSATGAERRDEEKEDDQQLEDSGGIERRICVAVVAGQAYTPHYRFLPMPTPDLVITGARVVTPDGEGPASIAIRDGVITAVTRDGGPDAARRIEVGEAELLMPGVVDTHVHVNEPGRTEWEGFETATRAAAAGGVPNIVDMPLNSVPVTTTAPALELKARAAARRAMVDYAVWGGVVPGPTGQRAPLARAGVRGFKCFLVPSGIDEFPPVAELQLRPAMTKLAGLGLPLLVHAELPGPIARAASSRGRDPRRSGSYLASRPRAAELEAVNLMLGLCRETGCRVHIVHVSAAETLDRLRDARRSGLPVTAETCPHYLTLAAEEIRDGATAWKCGPPIR